jgi:hypothetical protein
MSRRHNNMQSCLEKHPSIGGGATGTVESELGLIVTSFQTLPQGIGWRLKLGGAGNTGEDGIFLSEAKSAGLEDPDR